MDQHSLARSLDAALRSDPILGPRLQAIDALEAEVAKAVESVDLEIAFSPVIMEPGGTTQDAIEVAYKAADGRYVFDKPLKVVTAEELKLMRARYLITRGKEMEPMMARFLRR